MWNEVVLLASGLGLGWSLVNTRVCPADQVRGNLFRLALAGVAGMGMTIWLALSSLSSGLAAFLVVIGTAGLAYAANTRQVNRPHPALPPHPPQVADDASGTAVLLVTCAEPPRYNGPEYWAQALLEQDKAPFWFVRPRYYMHIRQAYDMMGNRHPLTEMLATLAEGLSASFSQVNTGVAYLGEQRAFLAQLVEVAESGINRLVLVPLEAELPLQKLKHLVQQAGLTDTNLEVIYAASPHITATSNRARTERLLLLEDGKPVAIPPISSQEMSVLKDIIAQSLERAANLDSI